MRIKELADTLRHHLHFIVVMPLLIILMTWPVFFQIFNSDDFWLARQNIDSNMIVWDAWYLKLLLGGQANFYYTDLLFHPTGVSLAFHNFCLPHMIVFAGLQTVLPASSAFNATFLLLSFLTAAAGYVYLNYLFGDKWIALFGAAVFGAGSFVLSRQAHPNIAFIATIPLSLYFLHCGLLEGRLKPLIVAGAFIGATAFIGMYTLVCLLMMLAAYLLYFACRRWAQREFWLHIFLMTLVIGAFVALRFYPMLVDPQGVANALSKGAGREVAKDFLGYFVNTQHPITQPILTALFPIKRFDLNWSNVVFLGYIPMLLFSWALLRSENRRRLLPWLALALVFLILRLGSFLTLNGVDYPNFVLPLRTLKEAVPQLFQPFWAVDNFHAGALFPFAVLACYGLRQVLRSVSTRRRLVAILILTGATAFEYFEPRVSEDFPAARLEFIAWLQGKPDQDSIRLIHVPFGTQQQKVYGYYQTYNGYPHAAGRPTRTPETAFDYIRSNFILGAWNAGDGVACLPGNREDFVAAQEQLLADGFTHIVVHRYWRSVASESKTLLYLPAAYEDDYVLIFRVEDLRLNCKSEAILNAGAQSLLTTFTGAGAILPAKRVSVLSLHDDEMTDGQLFSYYSALAESGAKPLPLREEDLAGGQTPSPVVPLIDRGAALAGNDIVLIAYDPRFSDTIDPAPYEDWVAREFAPCGLAVDSDSAVVTLYLRPDFPCALLTGVQPLGAQFDNGARLGSLITETRGAFLDVYFVWDKLPAENHSVSIQIFDSAGAKIHNQDFVLADDAFAHHQTDVTPLAPGDYQVKLILYNYATGASVPGEKIGSGARFDREFEIGDLAVD